MKRFDLLSFLHLGIYEFLPHWDWLSILGHAICDDEHPESLEVCVNVLGLFMPPELIDPSMISFYLDHFPGGSTIEMFAHFAQLSLVPGRFVKYDFGTAGNLEHYGQEEPPEYDLTKVTAPTVLFAGDSDSAAPVEDVDLLADVLPNLLDYQIVDYPGWTHASFALANNAGDLVFSEIIRFMEELD